MAAQTMAARRLVLTAAEFAQLVRAGAVDLPPGFAPDAVPDESAQRGASARLVERGVLAADAGTPVASVAANLAVLAAPTAAVRVEVSVQGGGLRAVFAVSGPVGASLFTLADGAVELSMFPAVTLGRELRRAVPPAELPSVDARVRKALGGHHDEPLAGRLPLAALGGYDETRRIVAPGDATGAIGGVRLTDEEQSLAERVAQRTTGTLWCLVTGRGGDGVLVGQVVWLCTDDGWVGLRPEPDGTDRQLVALLPVDGDALGVWLAPYLAEILEVAGERP